MPATVAERLRELSQHDRGAASIAGRAPARGSDRKAVDALPISEFYNQLRTGFRNERHHFAIAPQPASRFSNLSLGGAGQLLIDRDLVEALQSAIGDYSAMRRNASILTRGNGQSRVIPLLDDRATSAAIIPPGQPNTTTDVTFAGRKLEAFQFATPRLRVARSLLEDAPQLATAVFAIMGQRLGRGQNAAFTTGIGDGTQPSGILNAPVGVTTASNSAIAINELLALAAAIPDVYRQNAKWMMNGATWLYVMSIKDGEGRPVWKSSALSNWKIEINTNMPDIAASAVPIVFGDLSCYTILDVGDVYVKVLSEEYAEFAELGFEAWATADGTLADPSGQAVQSLQMHS